MLALKRVNPVARAVAVIGVVMALATGATFAALASSATLTGNTIGTASANADLLLWDSETETFAQSAQGFAFTELTPGDKSEPYGFSFKNNGNVDLNLTARVDGMPELSDGITGDDVMFKIYGHCHGGPVKTTLTDLVAGPVEMPCDPLEAGAEGTPGEWRDDANYWIKVKISDNVALDDTPETVGAFDIIFDGAAADAPEEPVEETPALPEENQAM